MVPKHYIMPNIAGPSDYQNFVQHRRTCLLKDILLCLSTSVAELKPCTADSRALTAAL